MEQTAEWLVALIRGIVGNPDEVSTTFKTDQMGVLFTVKVAKEDAGRVIGKEGKIARAIRELLHSVGLNHSIQASMKLDVPDKPNYNNAERNNQL